MTATQWQSYLNAHGAHIENDAVVDFGQPSQEIAQTAQSNTLCDLSHLALLEIDGADAVTFLQGQVTNDVKLLNGHVAHYTGYCSPKGRLLALFLAFAHQGHIHLQLPKPIAEAITKRLKMFVMRSKVTISDSADRIIKLGLNGPQATPLLLEHFSDVPTAPYTLSTLENATLLKLPSIDGHDRYQILTTVDFATPLWDSLKQKASPVGKPCWDWLEINAGIPEIVASTQEQFVPQMVNLDLLNAINFKKGCYTGQEIVARTHYLGSVKRRTFLMHIASEQVPNPNDKLLDSNGAEVGQIVRSAPAITGGFDVLAELRIEIQQAGPVYWQSYELTPKPLPYSLGLDEA